MNFGIFEGLKYEEIIEKYPKRYKDWTDNPIKVKIPEGETLESLSKRVREGLSLILSQHKDSEIALVTHGGPIRIILCDALRYDLEMFWQIEQEVCALNILDYSKKSLPSVVKINDVSHL
jgi:broad specificity phosphatase PhoE